MASLTTYYNTLQVGRNASDATIKQAYRTLVQKFHPDKNLGNTERALKNMLRLNEAYEVLSDPLRRAAYDQVIAERESALSVRQNFDYLRGETSPSWGEAPRHTGPLARTGAGAGSTAYPHRKPPEPQPDAGLVDLPWARLEALSRKPALWVGVLLVVVCAWLWAWRDGRLPPPQATQPTQSARTSSTRPATPQAPLTDEALKTQQYVQAVRDIEARHPVLNPRLPGYRKDLVEQVKTRTLAYVKQGMAAQLALQQAVRDMELATAVVNPHSPQITPGALSVQQRLAISVACGEPKPDAQPGADVAAYQACVRSTLARQRP